MVWFWDAGLPERRVQGADDFWGSTPSNPAFLLFYRLLPMRFDFLSPRHEQTAIPFA